MSYEDMAMVNTDSSMQYLIKIRSLIKNQLEVTNLHECFDGLINHVEKLLQASLDCGSVRTPSRKICWRITPPIRI